ncbi:uncharacterized protein LOC129739072 isoform X2 [Uranotaenia lowii]|uniref:uncharacterized protein LOC129739072 isoform X2 n=1 Tax=Uranotaenia lowii TaxID=190385 RepID=UPI002479E1BC|nr:uncharacterized protein LOC129739072 isoform X2 [Uranotaenia lowii]
MVCEAKLLMSKDENSFSTSSDDILFVTTRHNEQALLWVNHLKTCFDKITKQRGRLPFNFLHLKIDEGQITPDLVQRCLSTKLQIVIICPTLLSLSAQYLLSTLGSLLKPERVLGVLLDVTETRVWEIHKTTFPAYNKWRTCTVGDHEQSFVSELLGIATDILGRALRQQPLLCVDPATVLQNSSAAGPQKSQTPHQNHETFTLFPRKVKVGQNKIIVIFVEPLVKDDWIKIKVEKGNEIIEITNIKRRNPYTIQFSIPESCMEISMMIGIRLEKNNVDLGCRPLKCESRIRELEQILKAQDAPMEFLCQSLGIATSDRNRLDTYLLQSFQKNVPPNFHLLNSTDNSEGGLKMARETSPEEYPTLLHFAAYWGLERLCLQLMDCPGGDIACEIRNISGRTPVDLAELGGHYKLAKSFRNFSQLHEFSTMYHYFKGISDASSGKVIIEPKLTATAMFSSKIGSTKTASSKVEHNSKQHHQSEGYMEMNGSGSDIESSQSENINSVANLNYLNLDVAGGSGGGHDEVDFIFDQKKQAEKDKDILNNLNNSSEVDPIDHNILFNELRITEPEYYDSNDINRSDSFSQECSNVLENYTISDSCDSNYLIQPSNVPVKKIDNESDYLIQPSNIPVHEYSNLDVSSGLVRNKESESGRETSHLRLSFKKKESHESGSKSKSGTLKRQESNSSKKSVDDELLEILSDFKNNVFTIMEVEQLFDSWKSRNDVQKSVLDKREQLQQMREEYERIQQQMKEKLKRPTPFDRMKRIFSRSKSTDSKKNSPIEGVPVDVCDDIKFSLLTPAASSSSHRPISSSSLHSISSGSSGRVSILSSASFGDSGTHSDSEERRAGNPSFNANRTPRLNSLMDNYMIPPAPRPFITPSSTPTPVEEKDIPNFPPNNNDAAEHYTCIPSNKPIYPDSIYPYENCSMLMSIDETKETETAVQPIKVQRSEIIYTKLADIRPTMSSFKNNHSKETAQSHDSGS